jgi:GxxExxY protein
MTENAIAQQIVDAAFRIHTAIGPGLLESVYETLLSHDWADEDSPLSPSNRFR